MKRSRPKKLLNFKGHFRMKILFIEAFFKTTEPLSVMLLSALAKQKGHQIFLFNFDQGRADLKKYLEETKPDVVAYSAMTGDHRYLLQANEIVKSYDENIFTIMGGKHPTFFPEVIQNSDLDAICIGEGEDAWLELLCALENKKDVSDIANIATKKNFNDCILRPRRADLDRLPFLDYEICYQNMPFLGKSLKRTLMTSRGCPYNCTYCFNHIYNEMYCGKGPVLARQSVSRVIAEAKFMMARWPTKFIKFYDDDFVLKLDDWLHEFAERWPKEVGLPFHCLARADVIQREPKILQLLKMAGVRSISMSVESGNDYIRNNIFRRNMSKDQMQKAFEQAWNLGIYTFSNTIFAVPVTKPEKDKFNLPENLERDIESLDFNLKLKTTIAEYMPLFPYPKTEIGEYCRKNKFFDGDYDTFTISYQNKSPLNCFSSEEKMRQQNLGLLGMVLQAFAGSRNPLLRSFVPFLRFITVKFLIKFPFGKLYLLFYVAVLNYLHKAKIYSYQKFDLWQWVKDLPSSYSFNLKRQFE
jgi:anaerobic magnesium-protoporphyrin IX monomethyl ester cyclase